MTDKADALVLVRRSQLIELQAEVSDDASLAHERIRSILAAQPAASVDVEPVIQLMNHLEDVLPDEVFTLIATDKWNAVTNLCMAQRNAAGGAKGPFGELMALYSERERKATPKPAEGDGAVAGYISEGELKILRNPDWGGARIVRTQHDEYQIPLYTRTSAAAAVPVPEGLSWELRQRARNAGVVTGDLMNKAADALDARAAAPAAPKGGVDEALARLRAAPQNLWMADLVGQRISTDRMRAILTAALANQEQRHDALADGEAASA